MKTLKSEGSIDTDSKSANIPHIIDYYTCNNVSCGRGVNT